MRAKQLFEKWVATKVDMHGKSFDVFKNPTRNEWLKYQKSVNNEGARACVDRAGNLYFWEMDVLHDEVQEYSEFNLVNASLSLSGNDVYWTHFELARDSDTILYDSEIRQYADLIIDNPNIKRALGEYRLIGIDAELEYGSDSFEITWDWIEENVSR